MMHDRRERAQDRALDEQGKATELYEQGNLSVIVVRSYYTKPSIHVRKCHSDRLALMNSF